LNEAIVLNRVYDDMSARKSSQQPEENDSPLKRLREQANLTQEQLSVRLGVSTSTLRRWENGDVEPAMTREQWTVFCELLGVPFEQLPQKLNLRLPRRGSAKRSQ
jgi:transcriptional regulator with XRE-family HTH domain